VKAYVMRGKSDALDAKAICEAVQRPTMRFVPIMLGPRQGDGTGRSGVRVQVRLLQRNEPVVHMAESKPHCCGR
jgi:transposase